MLKAELTNEKSAALERAKQLFSDWRRAKNGRDRIPDKLWDAAADLFHTWGLSLNKSKRLFNHTLAELSSYATLAGSAKSDGFTYWGSRDL
jgi:hypothetical protein